MSDYTLDYVESHAFIGEDMVHALAEMTVWIHDNIPNATILSIDPDYLDDYAVVNVHYENLNG